MTVTPESTLAASIEHGVKIYGEGSTEVHALRGVSAGFERSRFTAIMGPSGSGKSTLMHCVAGLDDLTSGTVRLADIDLGTLNDRDLTTLRRQKVGFVFQAFNLVSTLTARENILLPLSIAGERPDGAWFDEVVDAVDLDDRLDHRPAELSGGQQQRVAVARALVTKPEIVFADEPSGNLDSKSGAELLEFMRRAVDDFGQTIVMVTHNPIDAAFADRVVFLDDGEVVHEMFEPTAARVLDTMKHLGE